MTEYLDPERRERLERYAVEHWGMTPADAASLVSQMSGPATDADLEGIANVLDNLAARVIPPSGDDVVFFGETIDMGDGIFWSANGVATIPGDEDGDPDG